jgi:hypothetical protein
VFEGGTCVCMCVCGVAGRHARWPQPRRAAQARVVRTLSSAVWQLP